MKVAVIFDNFGPYHLARLRYGSRVCSLLALEMNRLSADYAWVPDKAPRGFSSITVADGRTFSRCNRRRRPRAIRQALSDFAPHCVFIPGWGRRYSFESLAWCRSHRVPAIMMSESTQRDVRRFAWKEYIKRMIVQMCSAAFVAGTPQADYMERLGMPRDRIFQGYDVVDNGYFSRTISAVRRQSKHLRKKFKLPERYFLASARFMERKNLDRLLVAFARYRGSAGHAVTSEQATAEYQPWSLVLLGDGQQRAAINRFISKLGLGSVVFLPGFKQYWELPIYYGLASAFVQASLSEPWGLVVNEAMASGLPVLVSDRCGCAADLVRDERNGFTFDPYDVEQLSQLMLRLAQSPSLAAAMGEASVEIISNWGLNRFSGGLLSAAVKATETKFPRLALPQGLLLHLLSAR